MAGVIEKRGKGGGGGQGMKKVGGVEDGGEGEKNVWRGGGDGGPELAGVGDMLCAQRPKASVRGVADNDPWQGSGVLVLNARRHRCGGWVRRYIIGQRIAIVLNARRHRCGGWPAMDIGV